MDRITATVDAQNILGVPSTVDVRDARLMPPAGVFVYFLDADGCIVGPNMSPGPAVVVTATDTRGVPRRAHWGSFNGGGMGHVS